MEATLGSRISRFFLYLIVATAACTWLISNSAYAEGNDQDVSTTSVNTTSLETDADLRQINYDLWRGMHNVDDADTYEAYLELWQRAIERKTGQHVDISTFEFGQVVEVPSHPAAAEYTDWDEVPYADRPGLMINHFCGVMTGRVDENTGELQHDLGETAMRSELSNVAARIQEQLFEILLGGGVFSRPMCPLSMEAFLGDPDMYKDLLERQAARHDEAVADINGRLNALDARIGVDIDAAAAAAARADLELQREFQTGMAQISRESIARWDELKNQIGSLNMVLAEHADKVANLRQYVFDAVVAYCEARNDCRGPQGPQGPRGLQGPPGPAGQDADLSEFDEMLDELRRGHDDQQAQLDDHESRITVLEQQVGERKLGPDYCPVWLNFTGTRGVGEFNEDNPYNRGTPVSANLGINAEVAANHDAWIVSYDMPNERGIEPNDRADWWKESRYFDSLRAGAMIAITVSDGKDTCTVTHTLHGG